MDSYSYTPLDFSKNEIRVLRFLDSVSTGHPELIHCTLENISLDDYLPGFADMLVEMRLEYGPAATRFWMNLSNSKSDHMWLPAVQIPVAFWRRDPRRLDLAALEVDREIFPEEYVTLQCIMGLSSPEKRSPAPSKHRRNH